MELFNKLKEDLKKSMINKNEERKNFLRVIIGEINRKGNDVSDNDILSILKKLKENAKLMNNNFEVSVLDEYLPQMMPECELREIVENLVIKNGFSGMKDMGNVMKLLKNSDFAQYIDFKLASNIVKETLIGDMHP